MTQPSFTASAGAAPTHRNPKRPWIYRAGKKLRFRLNALLARHSLVPNDPVIPNSYFPWLAEVERATPLIRGEAQRLMDHLQAVPPMNQMSPDHERIAGDGGWRSFFLVGYGYRLETNCARMPETMRVLDKVPGLVTALFSILEPGMHIARHRGVTKGIVIAHLGLVVPQPAERCRMDVGGEVVTWREGRAFVFDDTYPHEVWNDTGGYRIILLVQFRRPMRWPGRLASALFIAAVRKSPFVQEARRNTDYWEKQLALSERELEPIAPRASRSD